MAFLRIILPIFVIVGFITALFVLYNPFLPEIDLQLLFRESRQASMILDRNGEPVITLNPAGIDWISLDKMPSLLPQAVVAVEDKRFYEHQGVDFRAILRALYQDLRYARTVQGGSTITQQLVKNLLLSREKTLLRKLLEVGYAVQIDRRYSKDQILEFYLNHIYLGHGVYGVGSAARFYFNRRLWELTPGEIALLVGLIRGPEYYSPFRDPQKALERKDLVLSILREQDLLTEEEYRGFSAAPLRVSAEPTSMAPGSYFADYIEQSLAKQYGWSAEYIRAGGLVIHATLDLHMQRVAEEIVSALPRDEAGRPQGALLALDPTSGEILAMVGGRNYRASRLNRAAEIRRQIGSAIKPLVFAAAVEAGYTQETIVLDEPTTYLINGREWRPQNFDDRYRGPITLKEALAESANMVAVQIVNNLGVEEVFSFMERMGLPLVRGGERNDRSLAPLSLGGLTTGVTLLELAESYTPLASKGVKSEPVGIRRVEDGKGRVLRSGRLRQDPVIAPEVAAMVTDMMREVIVSGTGRPADPGRPAAGKTGTTNKNTDAWFIGYTPDLLAVLWIGNDDRTPAMVGEKIIGSSAAAEYWGEFVRRALVRKPAREF